MKIKQYFTLAVIIVTVALSACSQKLRPNSPDVMYKNAVEHKKLVLPENTTDERGSLYLIPEVNTKGKPKNLSPSIKP